jgi:iron complex transport system ATP-binding protein
MTHGGFELTDVRVRAGGGEILCIPHLHVHDGTFATVIGTNGAGKTTLLKTCSGLIRPAQGKVSFAGADLGDLSSWARTKLRRQIGYIPQRTEYNARLPFTVREIVTMGRTSACGLFKPLTRRDNEIVDHWMQQVGLYEKRRQTFRSLSGGEQQKTLIARAMAQQPKVLMLDEPCSNLDFKWTAQIREMIGCLYVTEKVTVIMVSHELNAIPKSCRRMLLLDAGRVIIDDKPERVLASEEWRAAYGMSPAVLASNGSPGEQS